MGFAFFRRAFAPLEAISKASRRFLSPSSPACRPSSAIMLSIRDWWTAGATLLRACLSCGENGMGPDNSRCRLLLRLFFGSRFLLDGHAGGRVRAGGIGLDLDASRTAAGLRYRSGSGSG